MRNNFIRKGESKVTQFTSRQNITQLSETMPIPTCSAALQTSGSSSVDHEGDVAMEGIEIDLHALAAMVAQVNSIAAAN
ncbi:hypothetical protein K3495_g7651 [Podosphaera aphanis]|nr:hypothetical protein K3495_g7651 [Podosphaera aphanis]